jgi:hypothetical protein
MIRIRHKDEQRFPKTEGPRFKSRGVCLILAFSPGAPTSVSELAGYSRSELREVDGIGFDPRDGRRHQRLGRFERLSAPRRVSGLLALAVAAANTFLGDAN